MVQSLVGLAGIPERFFQGLEQGEYLLGLSRSLAAAL